MDTCACGKPWPCEETRAGRWFQIRKALTGGTPEFRNVWNSVCTQSESEEFRWIMALRSIGIKAAHPDDGWVNRSSPFYDLVQLINPYFNDGLKVGELLALGEPDHYRVRKIQAIEPESLFLSLLTTPKTTYRVIK
jgi:hypothetical protein